MGAVAIRHAAVHAARGLVAQLLLRQRQRKFMPVPDTLRDRFVFAIMPLEFEKAGNLAHVY